MENEELESLGILRQTKVPPELAWLTDPEKLFLLTMLDAGEMGLHRRIVVKAEKGSPDLAMRLFTNGLADWQRDKSGREMFFTISHKGEDIARMLVRIARNATRTTYHPEAAVAAPAEKTDVEASESAEGDKAPAA